MRTINVSVEVDAEDVVSELSDSDLHELLRRRMASHNGLSLTRSEGGPLSHVSSDALVARVEQQAREGGTPELRELVYRLTGRIV